MFSQYRWQISSEQDVEDRAKYRPPRDAQLNPNPWSSRVTHLSAISQVGFDPIAMAQAAIGGKGKMRNAENSQRVKCGKFCAERSAFYPLFIFRLPHSALSGGWRDRE